MNHPAQDRGVPLAGQKPDEFCQRIAQVLPGLCQALPQCFILRSQVAATCGLDRCPIEVHQGRRGAVGVECGLLSVVNHSAVGWVGCASVGAGRVVVVPVKLKRLLRIILITEKGKLGHLIGALMG